MRAIWQARVNATFLALLLGACAGEPGWERPGATAAEREAALDECRGEARAATRREAAIDQDIAATLQHEWQRSGIARGRRERMRDRERELGEDFLARCMAGKGWVRPG
jgi:hypothetical protein